MLYEVDTSPHSLSRARDLKIYEKEKKSRVIVFFFLFNFQMRKEEKMIGELEGDETFSSSLVFG